MSCFIRLRGLPWSVTNQEVLDFLKNVNVVNGTKGVHMVVNRSDGKSTGEAFVELESAEDENEAMKLNKNTIGHRYIEIFGATNEEAEQALKGLGPNAAHVLKLRGLPYEITEEMIEKFFDGLELKRNGILICMDRRGRVSGEGYVQFETAEDTEDALLRNKEKIGHRYIEIFRSSLAEMRRHMNNRPAPYDVNNRGSFRNNFGGNNGGGGNMNSMRDSGFGGGNNRNGNWSNNGGGGGGFGGNRPMGMNNSGFNQSGGGGGGGGGFGMFGGNGGGSGGFGNNSGNNFNRPNNMGMGNNSGGGGGGGNFGQGSQWNNNRNMGGSNNGMGQSFGGNNLGFNGNNGGNFGRGNGMMGGVGGGLGGRAGGGVGGGMMGGGNGIGGMMGGSGSGGMLGGNAGGIGGGGVGGLGGNGGGMAVGMGGGGSGFNNMPLPNKSNFNNTNNFNNDVVDDNDDLFCIHMRGLPYNTFENEICKFFQPLRPENVEIIFNNKGLHSGTANAYFESYEDSQLAMKKHKEQIGNRYIELFFDGKGGNKRNSRNQNF